MKKNHGLKLLAGSVVLVVAMVVMLHDNDSKAVETQNNPNNINEAIASQFNDNIRDVSARLVETERKLAQLSLENQKLLKEKLASASKPEKENHWEDNSGFLKQSIEKLKEEIALIKNKPTATHESSSSEYATDAYPIDGNGQKKSLAQKVVDIDAKLMKQHLTDEEVAYWNQQNARNHPIIRPKKNKPLKKKRKVLPFYTLPAGSDMNNTVLLSALIGEVPIDGKLMQPLFPFSAVISANDLIASNGVSLPPDIAGMKISGYAIGVGSFLDNISCVRAYVTAALFTFQDGHFVTVGKEQMSNSVDLVNNESIGYLTTSFGNPCIHGEYYTNAPQVLLAMLAAGGVQGLGSALSQWQMSYVASPLGATGAPTGSFGKYALGAAVSDGSIKAADWLEKRIQGSFDMVFVPASHPIHQGNQVSYSPTKVSFHLTQTIQLDKQLYGRLIDYGQAQITHDFNLK